MVWKRRLTKLLFVIATVCCMGLGNIQGSFDLYVPRDYSQPWMRNRKLIVNGQPYGFIVYQDSFIVGLQPSWDIQVCWADPGYTDCLPNLQWYPSCSQLSTDGRTADSTKCLNKKGIRAGENGHGGPRYDALNGNGLGYR